MASKASSVVVPSTPFETFRKEHPEVVFWVSQVAECRFHALAALALACLAKRVTGRPLKGIVTGLVAFPSLVTLDLLLAPDGRPQRSLSDSLTDSIRALIKQTAEEHAKGDGRELATFRCFRAVLSAKGKTTENVRDNGRCLFHAVAIHDNQRSSDELCIAALAAMQSNDTVKRACLDELRLARSHDVFSDGFPPDDDAKLATYCRKMAAVPSSGKSYPFPQDEIFPALAHVLSRPIRVFDMAQIQEPFPDDLRNTSPFLLHNPPNNGVTGEEIWVVLCCRHYYGVHNSTLDDVS